MSHLFFLSHARSDLGYLKQFADDLESELRSKLGSAEVLFRDTKSLEPGAKWNNELARALTTCRVFLYAQSPTYFSRPWCCKEWHAFSRRLDAFQDRPPLMIPILWEVCPNPPSAAAENQFVQEDLGDIYAREGLRYIIKIKKYENEYQEFLTRFSQKIITAMNRYPLTDSPALPVFDEFPESFRTSSEIISRTVLPNVQRGPRYAQFIYVVGKQAELKNKRTFCDPYGDDELGWKPFLPPSIDEIAILTQGIAANEKLICTHSACDAEQLMIQPRWALVDSEGQDSRLWSMETDALISLAQ